MDEKEATMGEEISGGRRRKQKSKKSRKSKRKSNNALEEWVKFVKKVQSEENIDSYKKAISRAKVRADKGEKWRSMKGGEGEEMGDKEEQKGGFYLGGMGDVTGGVVLGGRRRSRGRSRHRTMRRSRRRSSRRH
jgi:hypothetical protein